MTRIGRTRRIDPARADAYAEVGRRLLQAGRAIRELGDDRHASALAILAVHAAIAHVDAVCVRRGGRKSASDDHAAAVKLLRATLGNRLGADIVRTLDRLLAEKDRFEYQGYVVSSTEAERAWTATERIGSWAEAELIRG